MKDATQKLSVLEKVGYSLGDLAAKSYFSDPHDLSCFFLYRCI